MDLKHLADLFARVADAAAADPAVAEAVREALAQSRLLDVFGAGEALDVVDLLDVGGEEALRVRLRQMTLSELKQIVALRNYDPDKEAARWRSPNKLIELIVAQAAKQLEKEVAAQSSPGASWML